MTSTPHSPSGAPELASLDVLARYSPWPARLLGAEPWEPRIKTRAEILREFDSEKWGAIQRQLAANPSATVDMVEAWGLDPSSRTLVTATNDTWRFMTRHEARAAYVDIVGTALLQHMPRAAPSALVELGCGFGSIILRLAHRAAFRGLQFMAGELSPAGQDVTRQLARTSQVDVLVGECDLEADRITTLPVRKGAVIYTSYAAHYLPTGHRTFVAAVAALRPAVVVHFEPIYEHSDPNTTLGLMRRRYIEVNGYTRDLMSQIRSSGAIILSERPAVFGENPLLPASIVVWTPAPASDSAPRSSTETES